MNFCLSTVDAYLLQQEEARHEGLNGAQTAREHTEASAAAEGEDAASAGPGPGAPNSMKELLRQLAAVAAAAQRIPGGDDYTIKTNSSIGARRATETAAADTLRALLDVAGGCAGGGACLPPLRKAEAFHRDLAAGNSSRSSSSGSNGLLQQDGQHMHEAVAAGIQGLLDGLLEAVDVSLEAHRANPHAKIRIRLSPQQQQQQHHQQQQPQEGASARDIAAQQHQLLSKGREASLSIRRVLEGRPQSQWAFLIDNYSRRFVPRLHEKFHAKYPLSPSTVAAQRQRAQRMARRRDLYEETLAAAAAADSAAGQQQQRMLLVQQEEEGTQDEGESTEPLPHPYEGELRDLQWLIEGDKQQPGVYAGQSVSLALQRRWLLLLLLADGVISCVNLLLLLLPPQQLLLHLRV